jgi:gliding motility-associated-like protein
VNPTSNTDYLVTLIGGACIQQDTVHVRINNPITVNMVIDSISCFGVADAVIHAQASGGTQPFSYSWSANGTGADSIINVGRGNYTVTVSDVMNCNITGTADVSEPAQLSYAASFINIQCNGDSNGTATVTPTGGTPNYNYTWSPTQPNSGNVTGLPAGNYDVTITDAHGCTTTVSGSVTEPTALTVGVVKTDANCNTSLDGTATATVNGGTIPYNYAWDGVSGGNTTITGLDDDNHNLVVTDNNNCTISASFVIDTIYVLHIAVTATDASCFGVADGTATVTTLSGTAPFTYLWTPSGQTTAMATALAANTYSIIVTDTKNCVASDSAGITEPTEIVLTFNHNDPLCAGIANGTVDVTATGGAGTYTYDWAYVAGAPDNNSLTGLPAGIYDVTVSDASSCNSIGSDTLTNPPSLDAELINKKEITCANAMDGGVVVSVSGGTQPITFNWSNGSADSIQTNLAPGTYSVTVKDNNGCDTSLAVTFVAPPLIAIATLNVDSVSCPAYNDGNIHITGTGGTPGAVVPYEYSIDGTNFQPGESFAQLPAGSYHLIIRDGQGCTTDTTVQIYGPVKPVVSILPQDSTIKLGQAITLVSTVSDYTPADINFYSWSPTTGLACSDCANVLAAPYSQTAYTLLINYLSGCSVSQTVTVYVGDGEDFYIPNAFSPNGDGNNDVFVVYGYGFAKVNLKIFNRWGEKVCDTQNQWGGWDGTFKGQMQNAGVYTYVIQGVYLNGKTKEQKGTITLIR